MVTIRITGPECCGKTTLANELKLLLGGSIVHEVARDYLSVRESYSQSDLLEIARIQKTTEEELRNTNPSFLIADTGMLVLSIWHQEKYHKPNSWIQDQLQKSHYDITLLCAPDLPWVADPQRENPADRERLFKIYRQALDEQKLAYLVVEGAGEQRLKSVLNYLKQKGHITV